MPAHATVPLTLPRPTRRLRPTLAAFACSLALAAQAQTPSPAAAPQRGWLRFADGNQLSGVLLSRSPGGGRVRTDRFGELDFRDDEARFEIDPPAPAPSATPTPQAVDDTDNGWRPATWSIGISGYWQQKAGSTTSNIELDGDATWRARRDEVRLALSADYKVVDNEVDNNEQSGSLRWLHQLRGPWVSLASLRLERSTATLDPLPSFDYLLLQTTLGLGWRQVWSEESHTLVALNAEQIRLGLLRLDRHLTTQARSLLVENRLRLSAKVRLENSLIVYRWRQGDTGIDSNTELSYDLTDSLRVGLRHEARRNAVDLAVGRYSRLSLTTRVAF